jgi:hypothetical protein
MVVGVRRPAAGGVCLVAPPTVPGYLLHCCDPPGAMRCQCHPRPQSLAALSEGASAGIRARHGGAHACWWAVGVGFAGLVWHGGRHAWCRGGVGRTRAMPAAGGARPVRDMGWKGACLRPDLRNMRQAGSTGASCARRRRPLQPSQSPSGGADRKQWERTAAAARGKETGRRRNGDSLLSLSLCRSLR